MAKANAVSYKHIFNKDKLKTSFDINNTHKHRRTNSHCNEDECKSNVVNNKKHKYYKLYLNDSAYLKNIDKYAKVLPRKSCLPSHIKADTIVTVTNCNDLYTVPTNVNTNTIVGKTSLPKIITPSLNITPKHVKVIKIPNIYLQHKHTINNIPLSFRAHSHNTYELLEQQVIDSYMKKMENVRSFSMSKILNNSKRINSITNITSASNSDKMNCSIEWLNVNDSNNDIKNSLSLNNSRRSQISQSSACVFGKEYLKGNKHLYKEGVKVKKRLKEERSHNAKNVFKDVNERNVKVMKKKMLCKFYDELKYYYDIKDKLKYNIVNALECNRDKYNKELDMYQEGFSYRNKGDIRDNDINKNKEMLMNYHLLRKRADTNNTVHNIKLKFIHNNANRVSNIN